MQSWVLRSHNTATLISDSKRDIGLDSPKGNKELSPKGIVDDEGAVIKCYDRFNNWRNSFEDSDGLLCLSFGLAAFHKV